MKNTIKRFRGWHRRKEQKRSNQDPLPFVWKLALYEHADNNIRLAKEYAAFISQSKNLKERELKYRCINILPRGVPMREIEELFGYLSDGAHNI